MAHTGVHEGKNLKRLREIMHVKQDTIADALDMSQQAISLIESKETIDPELLEQICNILNIPVDAVREFNEDKAVQIIATTFSNTNHDQAAFFQTNHNPTFNPLDKIVELYERISKEKDAEIARLREELAAAKTKAKK